MRQTLRRCLDIGKRPREQDLCLLVTGLGTRRVHALFDSIRLLTVDLSAAELAKLVVFFTRLEDLQEPYRIGRGSTTVVPRLLHELSRRDARLPKGPWRELLIALREELKPALVSSGTAVAAQDQHGAEGPGRTSLPTPLHVVPESPNKAEK